MVIGVMAQAYPGIVTWVDEFITWRIYLGGADRPDTMPRVPPASEIVLGIDLGTSNSTAAAYVDGKFVYALDTRGEACIPSVVHFPAKGPPLVGAEADRLRATDAPNTIFGIKRIVGRSLDSPQGRVLDASSAFKLKGQLGSEAKVVTRAGDMTATEVAAVIMRHLRERAELRLGRQVSKAVVTVPVGVPQEVQDAMVRCGKIARLEIVRIIPEPVAGALARGIGSASAEGIPVLVYDIDG